MIWLKATSMKDRFIEYYMDIAIRTAKLSRARRLQVGAIIVKDDKIISYGYNGTPAGWSNYCERAVFPDDEAGAWVDINDIYPFENEYGSRYKLETLPEVLHAETNALAKLAKSIESGEGATMFCTHAPCIDCAKMIYQAGIKTLYYNEVYRSNAGLEFLEKAKVTIKQHK